MSDEALEVTFVMPCLDEAETLAGCIQAARACIERHGLDAEIVVADNGSSDGSQEIARAEGARVVDVPEPGYGSALMGGFEAARGRYLVMGDADQRYDFGEAIAMIEAMRDGADLVMGSRFRGEIRSGAMPWLHRYIGNPVLTFVGRLLFPTKISDFHCGLRGLTRKAYEEMGLRTTGMEFASEMVVKAVSREMNVAEVPITLHPDGRSRPPHLRSWRDGWRHLRFLMVLSPRWSLFVPGGLLVLLGGFLMALLGLGPLRLASVTLDIHTMMAASILVIVGYQAMTTGIAARIYAVEEEIGPPAPWLQSAFRHFTLERGILAGLALASAGGLVIARLAWQWARVGFGPLETDLTLRPMVLGTTLVALGMQTLFMSLVYSMLGIRRRRDG
ncbi:MAG: glycosyltransferase family 2 protein [Myxococcota bacterium]